MISVGVSACLTTYSMCLFFSAGEDAEGGAAAEGAAGATDHTVGGAAGATGPASYPTMQHTHRTSVCVLVVFVALGLNILYFFNFLHMTGQVRRGRGPVRGCGYD